MGIQTHQLPSQIGALRHSNYVLIPDWVQPSHYLFVVLATKFSNLVQKKKKKIRPVRLVRPWPAILSQC